MKAPKPKASREADLQEALARYLSPQLTDEAFLVKEVNICQGAARIDLLCIDQKLHAYELKSRLDTLERWQEQLVQYQRVFERLSIVIGVNHLGRTLNEIPNWCGVLLAEFSADRPTLEPFREASTNPNREAYAIAQMFWRQEALSVLEAHGCDRGVRSKARPAIWERMAASLSVQDLTVELLGVLKARGSDWRVDARLPQSRKSTRTVRRGRRRRRRRRS